MPAVTATNVRWITDRFRERVGNPYVYGGVWSAGNPRQGCDCSALAAHILNGVLYGPAMSWQRIDPASGAWITTESWRPVGEGQRGPFGTIVVSQPRDIPADAAVKLAIHHGPGGGANSHMWVEFNGHRAESAGGKGQVTGSAARPITDPYANDWAYLPANGPQSPVHVPTPWLEVGSTGDAVARLQHGLRANFEAYAGSLDVTGRFDAATAAAVREFQLRTGAEVDGIVGPETAGLLAAHGITLDGPAPTQPPPPTPPHSLTDRQLLIEIWDQLRGPGGQGWPQLDGRTVVDTLAHLLKPAHSHDGGT